MYYNFNTYLFLYIVQHIVVKIEFFSLAQKRRVVRFWSKREGYDYGRKRLCPADQCYSVSCSWYLLTATSVSWKNL